MSAIALSRHKIYQADDLLCMPTEPRYELIRGELAPMPNNNAQHGNVTARLTVPIGAYILANDLGEPFIAETRFTIEENPDTVLAPDFAFVSEARLPQDIPSKYLRLAPDLVVETVSPGDTKREVGLKVARWLAAGTILVWVVEPRQHTVTVHRAGRDPQILGVEDTLEGEEVVPGFRFPIRQMFRNLASA